MPLLSEGPLTCDDCQEVATRHGMGWKFCRKHFLLFIEKLEQDRMDELAMDARAEQEEMTEYEHEESYL